MTFALEMDLHLRASESERLTGRSRADLAGQELLLS